MNLTYTNHTLDRAPLDALVREQEIRVPCQIFLTLNPLTLYVKECTQDPLPLYWKDPDDRLWALRVPIKRYWTRLDLDRIQSPLIVPAGYRLGKKFHPPSHRTLYVFTPDSRPRYRGIQIFGDHYPHPRF